LNNPKVRAAELQSNTSQLLSEVCLLI
jgi:hypothetical protein